MDVSPYVQAWTHRRPSGNQYAPADNLVHAVPEGASGGFGSARALCGKQVNIVFDKDWPPRVHAQCPSCAAEIQQRGQ